MACPTYPNLGNNSRGQPSGEVPQLLQVRPASLLDGFLRSLVTSQVPIPWEEISPNIIKYPYDIHQWIDFRENPQEIICFSPISFLEGVNPVTNPQVISYVQDMSALDRRMEMAQSKPPIGVEAPGRCGWGSESAFNP